MKTNNTERSFLLFSLIITAILAITIIYPFLSVIALALSLTVILKPVYIWICKHMVKIPWIASLLTVISFLVILCVPLFFVGNIIVGQAQSAYSHLSENSNPSEFIEAINISINNILPTGFQVNVHEKIVSMVSFISNNITTFFASTFKTGLMFFVMILTIFYLLKDGDEWKKSLISLSPISEDNAREILTNLNNSIKAILGGSLLVAIIQGTLVGIGLEIFGVPNPAIWGVIATTLSFLPGVGIAMIYIPSIIFLYVTGMPLHALGLLLWFGTFVLIIDNILSPYFMSRNSDVPSLFILFAILGGVSVMGPIGIFIGPIVISLLYSLVAIYKKEFIVITQSSQL